MEWEDRNDGTISLWDEDRAKRVTLINRKNGKHYSFLLRQSLVVGRKEGFCDVSITTDDRYVSRRHLRFIREGNDVCVEDLKTRNGTELNGSRLISRKRIRRGDVLKIGRSEFEVIL